LPAIEYLHGTHTADDVIVSLIKGELRLWPGQESALVTEFIQYPRLKALHVFIGGGDLHELTTVIEPQLVICARQNQCQRITGIGRKGWEKALPDYEKRMILMEKDL
tara:strand:- start:57 stop:377 length:321 start_codon:yes stop_codon:yes gene_type:complete